MLLSESTLTVNGLGILLIFLTIFLVIVVFGGARLARARFSLLGDSLVRIAVGIALILFVAVVFSGALDEAAGLITDND